jgi:hypothetical protein
MSSLVVVLPQLPVMPMKTTRWSPTLLQRTVSPSRMRLYRGPRRCCLVTRRALTSSLRAPNRLSAWSKSYMDILLVTCMNPLLTTVLSPSPPRGRHWCGDHVPEVESRASTPSLRRRIYAAAACLSSSLFSLAWGASVMRAETAIRMIYVDDYKEEIFMDNGRIVGL